jgi:hypothetical protein
LLSDGEVAQSVERGTENPCVGGSIPSLAISFFPKKLSLSLLAPELRIRRL